MKAAASDKNTVSSQPKDKSSKVAPPTSTNPAAAKSGSLLQLFKQETPKKSS